MASRYDWIEGYPWWPAFRTYLKSELSVYTVSNYSKHIFAWLLTRQPAQDYLASITDKNQYHVADFAFRKLEPWLKGRAPKLHAQYFPPGWKPANPGNLTAGPMLTELEVMAVLARMNKDAPAVAFVFAWMCYYCKAHQAYLVRMKVSDVLLNADPPAVILRPKHLPARRVTLDKKTADILMRYMKSRANFMVIWRNKDCEELWVKPNGSPMRGSAAVFKHLEAAFEKVGFRPCPSAPMQRMIYARHRHLTERLGSRALADAALGFSSLTAGIATPGDLPTELPPDTFVPDTPS